MSLCPVDKKLTSTLSMNKLFAHLLSIWKEHPLSHSSWILLYGFLKEKDILSSSHSETLKETRRAQHKVCNSYFPPWAQITFIQCLYFFPDPRLRVALKAHMVPEKDAVSRPELASPKCACQYTVINTDRPVSQASFPLVWKQFAWPRLALRTPSSTAFGSTAEE